MVTVANWVTLARIAAIPLFVLVLYLPTRYAKLIAAGVFCVIAATDALDGWLARKRKEVTTTGALLDPLADKLLVSAALIFLIGRGIDAWMAYVIVAREFAVTGLRLVARTAVKASLLGKAKTVSQIGGVVAVLAGMPGAWFVMLFATILTVVSGVDYFWRARSALR